MYSANLKVPLVVLVVTPGRRLYCFKITQAQRRTLCYLIPAAAGAIAKILLQN